jgi:uncharacterized protein (TIGR03437 family)
LLVVALFCHTAAYAGVALEPIGASTTDRTAKSQNSDRKAYITFYNNLSFDVDLYWINFEGNRVFYESIGANSSHAQATFMTHPWLLVKKGTGGTTAEGTGELVSAFLPFTPNPGSAAGGDTATLGVGTDLSTSVNPTSLAFDGFQNGPLQKAYLEIGADRPGQRFTIDKVGSWLKATPTSGTTPAVITVEADPFGLPPNGVYPGTILVNAPGATPSQIGVPVIFGVGNPRPAQLVASPNSLKFDFRPGLDSLLRCFTVSNAGSGTIGPIQVAVETADPVTFRIGRPSITVGPANNEVVCVIASNAAAGSHSGQVLLSLDGETVLTVPIVQQTLPPKIGVSPGSIFIGGLPPDLPGSQNPVEHTIVRPLTLSRIFGAGTATYQATGDPSWVSANPPSGGFIGETAPLSLVLKFTHLAQGGYFGRLTVDDGVTHANPSTVPVVVEVSNESPRPVELVATRSFPLTPSDHPSEVYRLRSNSAVERSVQITADYENGPAFFTFVRLPAEPPVSVGGVTYPVRVSLSNPLPPPGVYFGKLILTYANQVASADVMASIPPGATQLRADRAAQVGIDRQNAPLEAQAVNQACTPTRIVPLVRTPLQNFSLKTAWPTALSVVMADDCANLQNAGAVVASFSNGDPTLSMDPVGDGEWVSTWVGQNPSDHVELTFTANSQDGTLTGSASLLGSLELNPLNPPLIVAGGVVNGASFAGGGTLSPGSFVSIFGSGLANERLSAPSVPLPETLAGASVEIGGVLAPVFYASDGQVNAIVPYGIPVDGALDVTVKRGDALAVPRPVPFTAAAPGIFAYGDQLGIVVGVNPDGTQPLADPSHPVTAQQPVVAYATGLGEVSPAVQAGTQTPLDVLARTVAPVTMTIGGIEARVDFAGLTPGSTGLYQINAVVPAGVTAGDRVPVVATAAGQSSAAVYISVR